MKKIQDFYKEMSLMELLTIYKKVQQPFFQSDNNNTERINSFYNIVLKNDIVNSKKELIKEILSRSQFYFKIEKINNKLNNYSEYNEDLIEEVIICLSIIFSEWEIAKKSKILVDFAHLNGYIEVELPNIYIENKKEETLSRIYKNRESRKKFYAQ